MKQNPRYFALFLVVMLVSILIAGAHATPGQAAGSAPSLTPSSVAVPHTGGGANSWWLRWKLDMPLADHTRWTENNGFSYFTGQLHVEVGPYGQAAIAWTAPDVPVRCVIVPKSASAPQFVLPTQSPTDIDFTYHFLDCKFPSIRDTAYALGYPVAIYDHEDFWDMLAGNNVNMVIQANLDPDGSGVFFMHRSLVLEKTVVDDNNEQTISMLMFDDRGLPESSGNLNYFETSHTATMPGVPGWEIEIIPGEIHWNGMVETRPGQNLAWWMDGAQFTLGEGFDGWMGDFWIDPKTGQTTGT